MLALMIAVPSLSYAVCEKSMCAYFNQGENNRYKDPYRNVQREGQNLEKVVIDVINRAEKSILAKALVRARDRGVEVKVIVENIYNKPLRVLSDDEFDRLDTHSKNRYLEAFEFIDINGDGAISLKERQIREAYHIFKKANLLTKDDTFDGSKGSGTMHHKFLVIDGKIVLTGSANLTLSGVHGDSSKTIDDSLGNANSLMYFRSKKLAKHFALEFSFMWDFHFFGKNKPYRKPKKFKVGESDVLVQFSPTHHSRPFEASVPGTISREITGARESIVVAQFVFSDQRLSNSLARAHKKGVKVQGLFDSLFAFRYYSTLLDMWGLELLRPNNCRSQTGNSPWNEPLSTQVGMAETPRGDKFHHKFAVVDDKKLLYGSYNWSKGADALNDETFMVIENSQIALKFAHQFAYHQSKAPLQGPPLWLLERIDKRKKQCGFF